MPDLKLRSSQVAELWKRYKDSNDPSAREQLILAYVRLVKYVAGRVAIGLPPTVDTDDLVSYGIFGLLDAIDKFDPGRGIKFESYALSRIRGAILDGMRAADWVPRSVRSKARQLERVVAELESSLGRSATDQEIMDALGMSRQEYEKLLEDIQVTAITSLDEFLSEESGDDDRLRIGDTVANPAAADPVASLEVEAVKETLAGAIEQLPGRERTVVALYYYEGLTLKEIGKVLDVTESRISQIHTKAITRLRSRLGRMRDSVV